MEKRIRKSKEAFIIYETISIIIITTFLFGHFYFNNKINYNDSFKEINLKCLESNLKVSNNEDLINDLNNQINNYNNIDNEINNIKNEYFNSIKDLENKILKNETNKKIAYLTFDDGPYYNTYKVLDILDKYNVKATFFTTSINGEKCYDNGKENCYKLYKEYVKRGHTIANHTYTHAIFKGLYSSTNSFIDAVEKQENHIKEQTNGYITNIVRFPGGSNSAGSLKNSIIEKLRQKKYGWVDWTAQDGDGGKLASEEQAWTNLKSSINEKIEVVLFHDYNRITTSILPEVIEYLQNNNYILLPLFYESKAISK